CHRLGIDWVMKAMVYFYQGGTMNYHPHAVRCSYEGPIFLRILCILWKKVFQNHYHEPEF
ncbi:MAG: hypothetical protein IJJ26_07230, partial [Victivallales bacterium]|nr:hypothetical protein [Victivallales bacterium]